MPALGNESIYLKQYVRNLRGGSQPILARASDGLLYVVKFINNLQGPNLLFNESAGSELYGACGLEVPEWKPLLLLDSFIDGNPDCWIQTPEGRLRPAAGLCFGSRYLGGDGQRLIEFLPRASFTRVRNQTSFWLAWLVDVCAGHTDNRQAIFVEDAERGLDACFVDHGHLFGGPNADQRKNFHVSAYLDSRIYKKLTAQDALGLLDVIRALDSDRLWQRVNTMPDNWRQASALDGFQSALDRLSKPLLVQNVLNTIIDAHERSTEEIQSREPGRGWQPELPVLRPEVRGTGSKRKSFGDFACA
jgi:hypothetical protein